jgi:DNA uptake protein ComE-like DNA-binding protein
MRSSYRCLVSLFALAAPVAVGCGSDSSPIETPVVNAPTDDCPSGKCDSPNGSNTFQHKWAVDMKKVSSLYGTTSKYFFGVTAAEAGLPAGLPGGETVIWDQMARRNSDHSLHVEHTADPTVPEQVHVILEDGTRVDPKGYLNIIPMLKDTDPLKQTHIRKYMRNGDVIMYFHPEYTGMKSQMDRRASHVAMHYDYKDTAANREYVHHVDNPNGYGPRYNHSPDRHMPFHVFRFQPNPQRAFASATTDAIVETVEGVDFSGAQRDKVLQIANSADLNTLDAAVGLDRRAANNIINARQASGSIASLSALGKIPYIGPEALARLRNYAVANGAGASGFKISEGLASKYSLAARNWAFITNDLSPFADFFTLTLQQQSDLPAFANDAIKNTQMPVLYCSGLAYANLNLALNYPLNETGLGAELWPLFQQTKYKNSDFSTEITANVLQDTAKLRSINELVFRPYAATDILNAWVEISLGHFPMPVIKGILSSPGFAQQVVGAYRNLEWSDSQAGTEKASQSQFPPATIENVQRWVSAYGLTQADTAAFLSADPALKEKFDAIGIPVTGLTPMDALQAVERELLDNRFVPPRIWMDEADQADSNMVYVGTVLNCELLSDLNGTEDACSLGGGGSDSFAEGAAETSTYAHYGISNGGQRTHRRFDATPGPETFGVGTKVTVAATAPGTSDIMFLLHLPEHWAGEPTVDMSVIDYDRYCTERNPSKTCAPAKGVVLDILPTEQRAINAEEFAVDLIGHGCEIEDAANVRCNVATRQADGSYVMASELVPRTSRGLWTVTMVDRGVETTGSPLDRCAFCATGGAQFNLWRLLVRND